MARPTLAEGYSKWRGETEELYEYRSPSSPFVPVLGLVGVYVSLIGTEEKLTSYHWRGSVLANVDAFEGLKRSLDRITYVRGRLDATAPMAVSRELTSEYNSQQGRRAHESLIDGLPEELHAVAQNEAFLAETLGYAAHDFAVSFEPLRLSQDGEAAFTVIYPKTARFVAEQS